MQFASKQQKRIWRSGSVDKKETLNLSADSALLLEPKPISWNVAREKETNLQGWWDWWWWEGEVKIAIATGTEARAEFALQHHHHHQHNATPSLKSKSSQTQERKFPTYPANPINQKHTKLKKFCNKNEILQTLSLSLSLNIITPGPIPHQTLNSKSCPKVPKKKKKTVAQVSSWDFRAL